MLFIRLGIDLWSGGIRSSFLIRSAPLTCPAHTSLLISNLRSQGRVLWLSTMDEGRRQALKSNHHSLRSGLIVKNILPAFRPYLTDIEYLRVESQTGNVAQVDELVAILLTKEDRHFDEFCRVCERNGYQHLARWLRAAAGAHRHAVEPEGT